MRCALTFRVLEPMGWNGFSKKQTVFFSVTINLQNLCSKLPTTIKGVENMSLDFWKKGGGRVFFLKMTVVFMCWVDLL